MRKPSLLVLTLLLALSLALVACADEDVPSEEATLSPTELPSNPTVPPPAAGTTVDAITGTATVETIDVTVPEAGANEVQVTVHGNLNDGCTHIESVDVTDTEENTFQVTISTWRETDALCTQALVPFEETFALDVGGLSPGTYTVEVNGAVETFTLPEETAAATAAPQPTPVLSLGGGSVIPGGTLEVRGSDFPAGTVLELGAGPQNAEYELVASATADDAGSFAQAVTVPDQATAGEMWVIVAEADGETVVSEPFTIIPLATPEVPAATSTTSGVNVPVDGQFTRTQIYLVALEDAGQTGEEIGCGDSLIPVEVEIEPTIAPLRAALEQLLAVDSEYYGQSGLYNALYRSDLQVEGIDIVNREAIIHLGGELNLGGACDNPRVAAQLRATALQFSTVDSVSIQVNGTPLTELLSGQ